jgi:DNA repair photolyase
LKDALMPSGNLTVCPGPLRFDSYDGCPSGCAYCFARIAAMSGTASKHDTFNAPEPRKLNLTLKQLLGEGRSAIAAFRAMDIPVHMGGMSDCFQPLERQHQVTLKAMEVFAANDIPVILSTKFRLLLEEPWRSAWEAIPRRLLQVSLIAADDRLARLEPNAPTWQERIAFVTEMSQTGPVMVRLQPCILPFSMLTVGKLAEAVAEAGGKGITVEGLKLPNRARAWMDGQLKAILGKAYETPKAGGTSDKEYTFGQRFAYQLAAKKVCREHGLRHWAADNAQRWLGDSPNCCGQDLLPGVGIWEANWGHAADLALREGRVTFAAMGAAMGANATNIINSGDGAKAREWAAGDIYPGAAKKKWLPLADINPSNLNLNLGNGANTRKIMSAANINPGDARVNPGDARVNPGDARVNTGDGAKAREWAKPTETDSGQTLLNWYRYQWNQGNKGRGPQAVMPNLVPTQKDEDGNLVYEFFLPPELRDAIEAVTGEPFGVPHHA